MKIQQLAVFLQNKPGHLSGICRTLADNGVNIVTLSLADTQQFGILRLIVKDWKLAAQKLEEAGYLVLFKPVPPPVLARTLCALLDNGGQQPGGAPCIS